MKNLSRGDAFVLLFAGDAKLSSTAINRGLNKLAQIGQSTTIGGHKVTRTGRGTYSVEKAK